MASESSKSASSLPTNDEKTAPSSGTPSDKAAASATSSPPKSAEKPSFVIGVLFGAIVMATGMYVLANFHHVGPALHRLRVHGTLKSFGRVVAPHGHLRVPDFQTDRYNILADNWDEYETTLSEFAEEALPENIVDFVVETLHSKAPEAAAAKLPPIPRVIYQTGPDPIDPEEHSFIVKNPRTGFHFLDDDGLEQWAEEYISGAKLHWIWKKMERMVLKTDLWRYMVLLWGGGFYSDLDTTCLKPIDKWGTIDAEVLDLTGHGFDMDEILAAPPQLIVGLEFDVPDYEGWETFWPRPIQVVQWTFASAPGHPVLLDAIRRSVNSMEKIINWEKNLKEIARDRIQEMVTEGTTLKRRGIILRELPSLMTANPFDVKQGGVMSLVDATGPGAFTDAVFSYLQARWNVHWSQIHDLKTSTRVGDVVILPITGFAPFEDADNPRWTGADTGPMAEVGDATHPHAMVLHGYEGSWRTPGDDLVAK